MKLFGLVVVFVAAAGCTKQNPNLCCTDEADCAAQGLSSDAQCADGLLCRGNQCIAVTCTASNECDASAPYCVDSSCSEGCTEDTQCPGFGQSAAPYCVGGACLQCRSDFADDCNSTSPICDSGTCRKCQSHEECPTGVCGDDGACATEVNIAYVTADGSATAACTRAAPCSIAHAITLGKPFVLLASGSYILANPLSVGGTQHLIGQGVASLRRSGTGPVVDIVLGSDVTFERLEITAATGTMDGIGINCGANPAGTRTVRLLRAVVSSNQLSGIYADSCTVYADRTVFKNNGNINFHDSSATITRCAIYEQASYLTFDSGTLTLMNSFIYRNGGGLDFYSTSTTNKIEFNTFVDNGNLTAGISCNPSNAPTSLLNNIFARNSPNTFGSKCTFPGSVIVDTDIAPLKFKSPGSAPYDYHLEAGSIAIDQATQSTLDIDFDGDARPSGGGRDVGADEFVP